MQTALKHINIYISMPTRKKSYKKTSLKNSLTVFKKL